MNDRVNRQYNMQGRKSGCDCQSVKTNEEIDAQKAVIADAAAEACDTVTRRRCEFSEPVCINASQIYDSCRDRDCVVDQRVYVTEADQEIIDNAINVKLKSVDIIWVDTDVEALSFNRGYFSVDIKFFGLVTMEVFCGLCNPTIVHGLTTFDKRIILYGSEGNSKTFSSKFKTGCTTDVVKSWKKINMPTVAVEVVEPVALSAKIKEAECCCGCDCCDCCEDTDNCCDCGCSIFPEGICGCFDGALAVDDDLRQVLITYGLFFIVRLERDTQLLVDAVDFCIPTKECPGATEESPCALFNDIRFPIDEFFPPKKRNDDNCGCGCK